MPNIAKITVQSETVAKSVIEKYPNLTKTAVRVAEGAGAKVIAHYVITGTSSVLDSASKWLSHNSHHHKVEVDE